MLCYKPRNAQDRNTRIELRAIERSAYVPNQEFLTYCPLAAGDMNELDALKRLAMFSNYAPSALTPSDLQARNPTPLKSALNEIKQSLF